MVRKVSYDMNHPVAVAVLPQREDAIARAEKEAKETIATVKQELEAAGWNRNAVAAYPARDVYGYAYDRARAKYQLYCSLTTTKKGVYNSCRQGEAFICEMYDNGCERHIEARKQAAADHYDSFISKLIKKIGECDSATLSGNHVWGFSFLTIAKGETTEVWKTQQIVNVSSKGLLFNQWPSRKMKGSK